MLAPNPNSGSSGWAVTTRTRSYFPFLCSSATASESKTGGGAAVFPVGETDFAAHAPGQAPGQEQPQPGPARVGVEPREPLERALALRGRDPGPTVQDEHADHVTVGRGRNGDGVPGRRV